MKTLLSVLIPLGLVLPPVNQTLSAQQNTGQNQLSTLVNQTLPPQEFSETDQPFPTTTITPSHTASGTASSILLPVMQTPATSSLTDKPATHFASTLSHTLTTIFNVLTTVVQGSFSQQTTPSSLGTLLDNVFDLVAQTSDKKGVELDSFIASLKTECRQSLNNTLAEMANNNTLDDYKRPSKNDEKEAKAQAALCNVATIVTGVANIVQDPHDKVNVGQSVGSILAGIINIALLASQKPRQQALYSLTEALNVE